MRWSEHCADIVWISRASGLGSGLIGIHLSEHQCGSGVHQCGSGLHQARIGFVLLVGIVFDVWIEPRFRMRGEPEVLSLRMSAAYLQFIAHAKRRFNLLHRMDVCVYGIVCVFARRVCVHWSEYRTDNEWISRHSDGTGVNTGPTTW